MKVFCLLTVPPGHYEHNCTLVLETIRTGFPNAEIFVYGNDYTPKFFRMKYIDAWFIPTKSMIHYEWINSILKDHSTYDKPIAIVDGDTIFWQSVEDLNPLYPYCGDYIPSHINDFSECFYFERLHTSFLWIRSVKELVSSVQSRLPKYSLLPETWNYLPVKLIAPELLAINRKHVFWDSCAKLYSFLPGSPFEPDTLSKFEHINSASFMHVMKDILPTDDAASFMNIHNTVNSLTDLTPLRGIGQKAKAYYESRRITLHDYLYPSTTPE